MRVGLILSAALLGGCAAQLTIIDRADGKRYVGQTGSTMGPKGEMSIEIEGETYRGTWIYQASGGSFSFGSFAGSTDFRGSSNSYNRTDTSFRGTGSMSGSTSGMTMSTVGNGMINASSPSGKYVRCIFTFNSMQDTGLGECQRNDGRVYDLNISR